MVPNGYTSVFMATLVLPTILAFFDNWAAPEHSSVKKQISELDQYGPERFGRLIFCHN